MAMSDTAPQKAPRRFEFPFSLRIEQRLSVPRWLPVLTSVGSLIVAFVIGGIVIWAAGGDPVASYVHIVDAAFGNVGVLNDTLVKATPLILIGLACALAF